MKGGVGMSNDFFRMTDIVKTYHMGDEEQTVLKHVNLTIDEGEFLSVLGPSGSGKSTLMNIIGCLDTPTSGEYVLRGRAIRNLDEDTLAAWDIGYAVFDSSVYAKFAADESWYAARYDVWYENAAYRVYKIK